MAGFDRYFLSMVDLNHKHSLATLNIVKVPIQFVIVFDLNGYLWCVGSSLEHAIDTSNVAISSLRLDYTLKLSVLSALQCF
jgi:hypothetical protein